MTVTYTNRKGRQYYLCQGVTKTGKSRYYFAREPKGEQVEQIPDGYEIRESVNGIVSLAKERPKLLAEQEIEIVKAALEKHPKARMYRLDAKSTELTIYEQVGPDFQELAKMLIGELGFPGTVPEDFNRRLEEEHDIYAQFTPIMKFIISDEEKRLFRAQRMCYLGSIDDWIDIEYNKSIEELASKLIPTLGTDAFFELF
jgi:hypothetical protein